MFSRTKFLSVGLAFGVIAIAGLTGFAQQPQNQDQRQLPDFNDTQRPFEPREGRGFRRESGPGGSFGPGVIRELNLTDDQKQQVRSIIEQTFTGTKAVREELQQLSEKRHQGALTAEDQARARTLHEQMQASMKETETKIAAILTPEQKAKAEELMKERHANHGRFGGPRRGFPGQPGQGNPPPQKPSNP